MNKKVWLITGAGRGMGAEIAKAALTAGHAVVATGRNSDAVSQALGQSSDLLTVALDVTSRSDAEGAVRAAVERFGRIDVLVNNAASVYAGYFEELTPEQFERQLSVSLMGPMNVTETATTTNSIAPPPSRSRRREVRPPARDGLQRDAYPPAATCSTAGVPARGGGRAAPAPTRSPECPPPVVPDPVPTQSGRAPSRRNNRTGSGRTGGRLPAHSRACAHPRSCVNRPFLASHRVCPERQLPFSDSIRCVTPPSDPVPPRAVPG